MFERFHRNNKWIYLVVLAMGWLGFCFAQTDGSDTIAGDLSINSGGDASFTAATLGALGDFLLTTAGDLSFHAGREEVSSESIFEQTTFSAAVTVSGGPVTRAAQIVSGAQLLADGGGEAGITGIAAGGLRTVNALTNGQFVPSFLQPKDGIDFGGPGTDDLPDGLTAGTLGGDLAGLGIGASLGLNFSSVENRSSSESYTGLANDLWTGGNLTINSGNDLYSEGTQFSADGEIELNAQGSVEFDHIQNTNYFDQYSNSIGFGAKFDLINGGLPTVSFNYNNSEATSDIGNALNTAFSAGNGISINAAGEIVRSEGLDWNRQHSDSSNLNLSLDLNLVNQLSSVLEQGGESILPTFNNLSFSELATLAKDNALNAIRDKATETLFYGSEAELSSLGHRSLLDGAAAFSATVIGHASPLEKLWSKDPTLNQFLKPVLHGVSAGLIAEGFGYEFAEGLGSGVASSFVGTYLNGFEGGDSLGGLAEFAGSLGAFGASGDSRLGSIFGQAIWENNEYGDLTFHIQKRQISLALLARALEDTKGLPLEEKIAYLSELDSDTLLAMGLLPVDLESFENRYELIEFLNEQIESQTVELASLLEKKSQVEAFPQLSFDEQLAFQDRTVNQLFLLLVDNGPPEYNGETYQSDLERYNDQKIDWNSKSDSEKFDYIFSSVNNEDDNFQSLSEIDQTRARQFIDNWFQESTSTTIAHREYYGDDGEWDFVDYNNSTTLVEEYSDEWKWDQNLTYYPEETYNFNDYRESVSEEIARVYHMDISSDLGILTGLVNNTFNQTLASGTRTYQQAVPAFEASGDGIWEARWNGLALAVAGETGIQAVYEATGGFGEYDPGTISINNGDFIVNDFDSSLEQWVHGGLGGVQVVGTAFGIQGVPRGIGQAYHSFTGNRIEVPGAQLLNQTIDLRIPEIDFSYNRIVSGVNDGFQRIGDSVLNGLDAAGDLLFGVPRSDLAFEGGFIIREVDDASVVNTNRLNSTNHSDGTSSGGGGSSGNTAAPDGGQQFTDQEIGDLADLDDRTRSGPDWGGNGADDWYPDLADPGAYDWKGLFPDNFWNGISREDRFSRVANALKTALGHSEILKQRRLVDANGNLLKDSDGKFRIVDFVIVDNKGKPVRIIETTSPSNVGSAGKLEQRITENQIFSNNPGAVYVRDSNGQLINVSNAERPAPFGLEPEAIDRR